MAGFASFIGGAGQAAQQQGQQIRGILEQRRGRLVDLFTQMAAAEPEDQKRASYMGLASDAASGQPWEKILPKVTKALETHVQGNAALSQAVGGPPQPPPQQPASVPGMTPGTGSAPAAQPPTSPVQPQAQTGGLPLAASLVAQGQQQPITPVQSSQQPQQNQPLGGMPESIGGIQSTSLMHTPAGQRMVQPFLQNQAELARSSAFAQQELGWKKASLDELMKSPEWDTLPGFTKAQFKMWASTPGQQMPSMMGMTGAMFNPIPMKGIKTEDFARQFPEAFAKSGIDPKNTPVVDFNINKITGQPETVMGKGIALRFSTDDQGRVIGVNPYDPGITPVQTGGVAQSQITPHFEPTAGGGVESVTSQGLRTGATPTPVPGAVAPGLLPHTTESLRSVTTTDANGNAVTELVPVSSTRTVGKPTASTAPGGVQPGIQGSGRTFEKPLTPEENLKANQQYGQYNQAINRAQRVIDNSHLLDSLLESGKLELNLHDGILSTLAGRGMKLTPAEAQMITDFNSLKESVNLIRGPLGATGFRGPEAFAALQAQRGGLLKNPQITRGVLQNFIQELQNQVKPLGDKLHKSPESVTTAAPNSTGGMTITLPSGKKVVIQ